MDQQLVLAARRIYLSSSDRAAADSLASFHALLPGFRARGPDCTNHRQCSSPTSPATHCFSERTFHDSDALQKQEIQSSSTFHVGDPRARALPMRVLKRILELTKLRARLGRMHVVAGLRAMGPIGTAIVV
jgi:hypothetical protein